VRLAILLIGQFDPMQEARVAEVRLRSDTVYLRGLSATEAREYLQKTVGRCFDDAAADAAVRSPAARNFLDLQEYLIGLMDRALMNGSERVTADIVGEREAEQAEIIDRNALLKAALGKRKRDFGSAQSNGSAQSKEAICQASVG
jgi:hypothetical protein